MHKILKESDSHFIVELPNGVTIKVAKNGLTDKVKDKVLYLAEGGLVPEKGFIPIPEGPTPLTVPVNVKAGAPIPRFENVRRATKEELDEPAQFAPGTPDVYRTAIDQVRPVKQAPFQPKVEEYAPGGAEEPFISPLDFITPPGLGAVAKGAGRLAKGIGTAGKAVGREVVEALPRVMASEVGAVGGQKVAPRINPLGMYSKLEQTLEEKMGGSATPEQIKGMLRDVKPEEMQYSGLNEFLEGKNKVSKQEVLDFVKANELPVQEKELGGSAYNKFVKDRKNLLDKISETSYQIVNSYAPKYATVDEYENYKNLIQTITNPEAHPKKIDKALEQVSNLTGFDKKQILQETDRLKKLRETEYNLVSPLDTKFSSYTLPGGENYREKLYTLPTGNKLPKDVKIELSPSKDFPDQVLVTKNGENLGYYVDKQSAIEDLAKQSGTNDYKSSHWNEPNVLAHTRLNDRIDDQGKKHLFVEEIQSDWHQAGRKKGYQENRNFDDELQKVYQEAEKYTSKGKNAPQELLDKATEIQDAKLKSQRANTVPDAPMKKTWHEFVSKNLLNDAAKGGYDNISWTTGAQQAERYDLSKQISDIKLAPYEDGGFQLIAKKDGQDVLRKEINNVSDAEEYIGKEATQVLQDKLNAGEKTPVLSGLELKVGGEGMKGFYDKMIPDYMAKIGKKYGVKPEKVEIPTGSKKTYPGTFDQTRTPLKEQVWTMKITPEMRKDILEKGLPLYSVGGAVAGGMLGNNEAEAKPMNYKMLENKKDFYVMQHPDGSTFKVAKKGLKPEVMKKIEGFSNFIQKANGGEIPGVDMPEQTASYMPEQPKEPDFAQMAMDNPRTPQDDIKEAEMQIQNRFMDPFASMGSSENYTPEGIRKMAEEQVLGERERQAQIQKNAQFVADQDQQKRIEETLAYNERAKRVGMPLRPVPGQKQELPLEMQTATAGQAKTDMPDMPPMATKKPETDPFKMYEEGLMGEARARQKGAEQQAETYKNLQTDLNAGNVEHNKKLEELYAKQKAFEDSASKAQVNPDRYWQNASVPRKLSASIGLILGGIGAGLTGGENAALKIINQTIDQDIEAQKKNIDQANNLYRMNLDAIKNEKEAYNVTKAQMIGVAELRLKEQMARTTSQEALAQGKIALGKMQLAKQQLLQQTALDQVVSVGQDNPQMITPEILEKLPADQRERFIPGYGFTISKPGAEKIRTELLPQKDTSVQMIDDLINIRKKYGRELTNRDVVNEANTLRSFLRGSMRTFLVGPGAVTENEQKILDQVIADPTKILTTDAGTLSALNSLKNSIDRSFVNQAKANGLMVKQPQQAQGQQPVRGDNGKFYIQQGQYMVPVRK